MLQCQRNCRGTNAMEGCEPDIPKEEDTPNNYVVLVKLVVSTGSATCLRTLDLILTNLCFLV